MKNNKNSSIELIDPANNWSANTPGIGYLRGFLESKGIDSSVINFNKFIDAKKMAMFKDDLLNTYYSLNFINKTKNITVDRTNILQALCGLKPAQLLRVVKKTKILNPIFDEVFTGRVHAQFYGISITFTFQLVFSMLLANYLRDKYGDRIKIVFGGSVVSRHTDDMINLLNNDRVVDYLILGEGELPLYQLVSGKELSAVYNLVYLENGKYKYSNRHHHFEDISKLPAPIYEPGDTIYLQISRKCYWGKCRFCVLDKYNYSNRIVFRSADKIVSDIEAINKRMGSNNKNCVFLDDSIPAEIITDVAQKILKNEQIKNNFASYLRCDKWIDASTLKLMKEAGFDLLKLGPETLIPRLMMIINKGFAKNKVLEIIEACHELGIKLVVHFMVSLPTQTKEELLEDLNSIKYLAEKYNNIIGIHVKHLRVEKNSRFYNNPGKYKLKLFYNQKKPFSDTIPHTSTDDELLSRKNVETVVNEFYNLHLKKYKCVKILFPKLI